MTQALTLHLLKEKDVELAALRSRVAKLEAHAESFPHSLTAERFSELLAAEAQLAATPDLSAVKALINQRLGGQTFPMQWQTDLAAALALDLKRDK